MPPALLSGTAADGACDTPPPFFGLDGFIATGKEADAPEAATLPRSGALHPPSSSRTGSATACPISSGLSSWTELTRDGLFECLRKRHHFGTTGTRMHLDVYASVKIWHGGVRMP